MEKLYTIKQVAKILGVHHLTIRRWIDEDKIKVIRLTERTMRITQTELDKFVDGKGVADNG